MHVRFLVFTLIFSLAIPALVTGQTPVVSPSELREAIAAAAKVRKKNLDDVQAFFKSEPVRAALNSSRIDHRRIDKGVATLSAEELERLAARTHRIQADFAAGALSNQELTYIVIALAVAVIVLIAVT
jgi:hypothetical protein